MLSIDEMYDILQNDFGVSEQTLDVVIAINGWSEETMEDILYAVSGYRSFEQCGYEDDDDDDEDIEGVGAVHTVITGEVVGIEWRNHSLYGNSSYWVYIKRDNGQFVKAYTAPNSSLAYQVERLQGNIVSFDATIRKDGGIVLNNTVGYEWESHRK